MENMKSLQEYEIIEQSNRLLLSIGYGEHLSSQNGQSSEFKDIVPYDSSEHSIRDINWKSSSKTGIFSANRYHDSKDVNIGIIYICSGSMVCGEPKSKHQSATEIITALSHAVTNRNDWLTTIYHASKIKINMPSTKSKNIASINHEILSSLKLLENTPQLNTLENHINSTITKNSLLFIIGDFLQIPNLDTISGKHATNCIIIRDKSDEELLLRGSHIFHDTDSNRAQISNISKKSAKLYAKAMREHDSKLEHYFSRLGIKSTKIYTHQESIPPLAKLLKRQIW